MTTYTLKTKVTVKGCLSDDKEGAEKTEYDFIIEVEEENEHDAQLTAYEELKEVFEEMVKDGNVKSDSFDFSVEEIFEGSIRS